MSTLESVLGVSGCVGSASTTRHNRNPHMARALAMCVGCVGFSRACACVRTISSMPHPASVIRIFLYAKTDKPNKPNTPNTEALKALIPLGFECVGFVLGWVVLCWVGISNGERGHD